MASKRQKSKGRPQVVLQYADTERGGDQFYFGGFLAPDPFISVGIGDEKVAFLSALEYGRGLRESDFDTILSLEEWRGRACKRFGLETGGIADVVREFCRVRRIHSLRVAENFPAGLAFRLREYGLSIEIAAGMLFPQREFKSDREAAAIAEGNRCSAAGIRAAERILRKSVVSGRTLVFEGRRLTSERLRMEIERTCLEMGAVSLNTIVAGGSQACDPHCRGTGVLRPHELIILDVFPKVTRTGYFGDLTRTFLKGHASDVQRGLVDAVRLAQKAALSKIRAGVRAHTVHTEVLQVFERLGFRTWKAESGPVGFIHGTGHGLGLEIHEPPRISSGGPRLRSNQVVSVEPGLYYPEVGGCRIEDIVRVRPDGIERLSRLHYRWLIR